MMRTQLTERYLPMFAALDETQVGLVWDRVREAWPDDFRPGVLAKLGTCLVDRPVNGEELFTICQVAGLDQARVVLSLAREWNGPGQSAIETLVGKPIVPWAETIEAQRAAVVPTKNGQTFDGHGKTVKVRDERVVVSVGPNPHAEGSELYLMYRWWKVGESVQTCVEAGLSRKNVRRNIRNKVVVVREP